MTIRTGEYFAAPVAIGDSCVFEMNRVVGSNISAVAMRLVRGKIRMEGMGIDVRKWGECYELVSVVSTWRKLSPLEIIAVEGAGPI